MRRKKNEVKKLLCLIGIAIATLLLMFIYSAQASADVPKETVLSKANKHTDILINYGIDERRKVYNVISNFKDKACVQKCREIANSMFSKGLVKMIVNHDSFAGKHPDIAKLEIGKLNPEGESIKVRYSADKGSCIGLLEVSRDVKNSSILTAMSIECKCDQLEAKCPACNSEQYPIKFTYRNGGVYNIQHGLITKRIAGSKLVETANLLKESSLDCCTKKQKGKKEEPKPPGGEDALPGEPPKVFGGPGLEIKNCQDCFNLRVKIHNLKADINSKKQEIQDLKDFNRLSENTIKGNLIKIENLKKEQKVHVYENPYNLKVITSEGRQLRDYEIPPDFKYKGFAVYHSKDDTKKKQEKIDDLEDEIKTLRAKIRANNAMIEILEDLIRETERRISELEELYKRCITVCQPPEKKAVIGVPLQPEKPKENLIKSCKCNEIKSQINDLKKENKDYKKDHNKADKADFKQQLQSLKRDLSACNSLCKPKSSGLGFGIHFGVSTETDRGRGCQTPASKPSCH